MAISSSNGCRYCVRSHTAAARKGGMTEAMLGELLAVVGMCNETNRLAQVRKLAQKLGQLQPFIAVFPQECMGQLASFEPA